MLGLRLIHVSKIQVAQKRISKQQFIMKYIITMRQLNDMKG